MTTLSSILQGLSVWALPLLFAITFHEAAHGYVAWRLGDDTAKVRGRVTFNPLRHIDPFGTVILPAMLLIVGSPFLFGYAKPVPVDFRRLRNPRQDMVWVAAAGPAINICLAVVSAFLVHLVPLFPEFAGQWLEHNLANSILINLVLAVFNMFPLPPLDGGRVAVGVLPRQLAMPLARLERHGMLILIGLLFVLPWIGQKIGVNVNIFTWFVLPPVNYLFDLIILITGLQ
ncbi:MAG: site-2 protease family protein [Rhodospirillales bacterium]|nr:site-2 protease family protein [Rhodospirillales bacterium]